MSESPHYLEASTTLVDDIVLHKEEGFTKEQTLKAMSIAFCRSWQIQCGDPLWRDNHPGEPSVPEPILAARTKAIAALWDYWTTLGGIGQAKE